MNFTIVEIVHIHRLVMLFYNELHIKLIAILTVVKFFVKNIESIL